MDSELTDGFTEACALCEAVDWGVSEEGRFYCRICHNVIERRKEAEAQTGGPGESRISSLGKVGVAKRLKRAQLWNLSEAFQFLLRKQACTLVDLGVSPHFKDRVLLPMWRLYQQLSRPAFTIPPAWASPNSKEVLDLGSESAVDSSATSSDEQAGSVAGSSQSAIFGGQQRQALTQMSKTLALIHLALVWSREPLTLSDLLRLVNDGHVPYINAHEGLPEEFQLEAPDMIFRVKDVPSHRSLCAEAETVARLLRLPTFPPVSYQSPLHPLPLALRYVAEANLPDELHPWVCALVERAGLMQEEVNTFCPNARGSLPLYDIQAAAIVILTVKLLFGLDDRSEWKMSSQVQDEDLELFSFQRWHSVLQRALLRAQQTHQMDQARRRWRSSKAPWVKRSSSMKNIRTADHVQNCFRSLLGQPAKLPAPYSIRFLWGNQDGAHGPSMHHQRLDPALGGNLHRLAPLQQLSSHFHLKSTALRIRRSWDTVLEKTLPHSLLWLLRFFCYLLQVPMDLLYPAVLNLERSLLRHQLGQDKPARKRAAAETRSWTLSSSSSTC